MIGKYRLTDWWRQYSWQYRLDFYLSYRMGPAESIMIEQLAPNGKWNIYLSIFNEEYIKIYGDHCYEFQTLEDAKERVETFLCKIDKLKAFI